MRLDDQLRVDLSREAERLPSDQATALANVYRRAERRRRALRARWTGAAVALVVLVALAVSTRFVTDLGGAPSPAGHPPPTSHNSSPVVPTADSSLAGEWQSGPTPVAQLRSSLIAKGVNPKVFDSVFRSGSKWFAQMTFGTGFGGSAELRCVTWDGARPDSSQQRADVVYRRLSGSRLVVSPPHPTTRWFFSYQLAGDRLSLHLTNIRGRMAAPDTARLLACTAAPLDLVR